MRIEYNLRNLEDGERRLREHAEPRLERLGQQYERIGELRVTASSQRNWRRVELTAEVRGALLRAEERNDDLLAAFDKALDRLQRQLRRFKQRSRDFTHESLRTLAAESAPAPRPQPEPEPEEELPELGPIRIVRTKAHALKPMTPEEAILQMELLGHDFFVFVDGASERVGVVYRRRDGDYGLIEPGPATE